MHCAPCCVFKDQTAAVTHQPCCAHSYIPRLCLQHCLLLFLCPCFSPAPQSLGVPTHLSPSQHLGSSRVLLALSGGVGADVESTVMKALGAPSAACAGLSAVPAGVSIWAPHGCRGRSCSPSAAWLGRALELHLHTVRNFLTTQGKQPPSGRTHPHQEGACKPDVPGGFRVKTGQKIQVVGR